MKKFEKLAPSVNPQRAREWVVITGDYLTREAVKAMTTREKQLEKLREEITRGTHTKSIYGKGYEPTYSIHWECHTERLRTILIYGHLATSTRTEFTRQQRQEQLQFKKVIPVTIQAPSQSPRMEIEA